jgi:DNA-binding LacI/PurR family transcriptional regulator
MELLSCMVKLNRMICWKNTIYLIFDCRAGRTVNSPRVHCINTDRATGMYQAVKYLISLNHTEIGYLSGPPEWDLSQVRLQGIQRALNEEGLTFNPKFHRWCFPTIEWGFQVTNSILRLPTYPTAIMTFNDLLAIGALHAIRTFGLTVPDDISVWDLTTSI